jgi:putative hydroxymethylpyrimidine transporter CytX
MKPETNKVTTFSQILLWFGAAVSIAEIFTGALLAPLGLKNGILAIVLGHIIGAVILFFAGIIGAKSGFSAARSVRISFGKYGSFGFSILNLLQLLGWTAIMIVNAAKSLDGITSQVFNYQNEKLWCVVIGLLICLWVAIGIKNLSKLNPFVISALFIFSIILGYIVFKQKSTVVSSSEIISFGSAIELNVVMCLSWLPLISDYTMRLQKPVSGTVGSVLGYFFGGILMFTIGLGAAIYAETPDISTILLTAGLGAIALFIVVISTVTTTFLDVYSAGVSIVNLNGKINEKIAAIITCIFGTLLAILVPMSQYMNFLYLIGSVFAPLFSILFVDYFMIDRKEINLQKTLNLKNVLLWCVGFVIYRLLMQYDTPVGITLPVMAAIGALYFLICKGSDVKNGK